MTTPESLLTFLTFLLLAGGMPALAQEGVTAQPTLSLDFDVSNEGGPSDRRTLTFRLELSAPAVRPVSVTYAVSDGAAPGMPAATGGGACSGAIDYLRTSGTTTLLPGMRQGIVAVTICGDATYETDERLTFRVTALTNAQMSGSSIVGVIVNDDARPVITVTVPNDGLVTEGSIRPTVVPISVTLSTANHTGASVTLLRGGTARAGTECSGQTDLVATTDTIRASWPAGNSDPWRVNLTVCGDSRDEENDTIELTAVLTVNADVAPGNRLRRLVIFDDDPPPVITVADVAVTEGSAAQVEVRLSAASDFDVEVLLTAASGTPPAGGLLATAGEACLSTVDFLAVRRRVVVPAGKTVASVAVTTCSNPDFGTNPATLPGPGYAEVFLVTASNPSGGTLGKAVGVVTVRDP